MGLLSGRPIGFTVIAIWSVLYGVSYLILAVRTPFFLLVGGIYLLGAYGIWQKAIWGGEIIILAWFLGAVAEVIFWGTPFGFIWLFILIGYLYLRRDSLDESDNTS